VNQKARKANSDWLPFTVRSSADPSYAHPADSVVALKKHPASIDCGHVKEKREYDKVNPKVGPSKQNQLITGTASSTHCAYLMAYCGLPSISLTSKQ